MYIQYRTEQTMQGTVNVQRRVIQKAISHLHTTAGGKKNHSTHDAPYSGACCHTIGEDGWNEILPSLLNAFQLNVNIKTAIKQNKENTCDNLPQFGIAHVVRAQFNLWSKMDLHYRVESCLSGSQPTPSQFCLIVFTHWPKWMFYHTG